MPRIRFNGRTLKSLKAPVSGQLDYFDERIPGFGLRITSSGHRSWIVLYRHGGRLRRLTLGPYPALPGVTAVYDRHSYDPEKRKAVDAWGAKVSSCVAATNPKVIELQRA